MNSRNISLNSEIFGSKKKELVFVLSSAFLIYIYSYANGFPLEEKVKNIIRNAIPTSQGSIPKEVNSRVITPQNLDETKLSESPREIDPQRSATAPNPPAQSTTVLEPTRNTETQVPAPVGGIVTNGLGTVAQETEELLPVELPISQSVGKVTETVNLIIPLL